MIIVDLSQLLLHDISSMVNVFFVFIDITVLASGRMGWYRYFL